MTTRDDSRELVPLLREDEQAVVEVWRELRDDYGPEKVTAKKVRGYVKRRLERVRRQERRKAEHLELEARWTGPDGSRLKSDEYVEYSSPQSRVVQGLRAGRRGR